MKKIVFAIVAIASTLFISCEKAQSTTDCCDSTDTVVVDSVVMDTLA